MNNEIFGFSFQSYTHSHENIVSVSEKPFKLNSKKHEQADRTNQLLTIPD